MKKLARFIATSAASLGLLGSVASAATVTCGNITNTGPDSTNIVRCVSENNTSVSCDNHIIVENSNDQNASSGGAFTTGNTNAGNSTSGDASNSNTTQVTVGASCAPVQTTSTTPTPPAGGQGGGTPVVAAPNKPAPAPAAPVGGRGGGEIAAVAVLPETGSSAVQNAAIAGVVVLAAGLVAGQAGVSAFRRTALKQ